MTQRRLKLIYRYTPSILQKIGLTVFVIGVILLFSKPYIGNASSTDVYWEIIWIMCVGVLVVWSWPGWPFDSERYRLKKEIEDIKLASLNLPQPIPINFTYLTLGSVYICNGYNHDGTFQIELEKHRNNEVNEFLLTSVGLRLENPFQNKSLPCRFIVEQKNPTGHDPYLKVVFLD